CARGKNNYAFGPSLDVW
nr:immunoglobulin heavy chain junction region [Macaca mulatta]MOV48882.1 immunoglobulin heavy chain junction region [Macaca mulatta]MOV49021.1 immunoglobulin heavy chain junction region [Macaca mulatta]MOV49127.1 immunoglobulin heavy chain junction region [Macaca mulatta]MOV49473.1 immunoglobulin heavy chain junction region [Macaca mulatta]